MKLEGPVPSFDVEMARRFLKALRNTDDNPIVVFQITDDRRTKDNPPRSECTAVYTGTVDLGVLPVVNAIGGAVFFQVNAGPRGSDITEILALAIDDDQKSGLPLPDSSKCPPSAIIRSSPESNPGKSHQYFFLKEGERVEDWLAAQQQLAAAWGTDPSTAKMSLCLRLPGSAHCKPGKPPELTVIEKIDGVEQLFRDRRYTIAEVLAAYPMPDKYAAVDAALAGETTKAGTEDDKVELPRKLDDTLELEGASQETFTRVCEWLTKRGRKFVLNPRRPRRIKLVRCPMNPDHTDAVIIIRGRGGIWAGCFHESCKSNKQAWKNFKSAIGGWAGIERGDHIELARKLLVDLKDESDEDVVHDTGGFYRYNAKTGVWEPIDEDRVQQQISLYAGLPYGPNNRPLHLKWHDVKSTALAARSFSTRRFFDDAPRGALFNNGFLRFSDGRLILEDRSPEHRARLLHPFDFDRNAEAPRWLRFMGEIFAGDVDAKAKSALIQEFFGICFLGLATRYQAALFLVGEGANGKSVMLTVLRALFPPEAISDVLPQRMAEDYHRVLLARSLMNIVTEIPERDLLDSGPFKAAVDGSPMTGRQIYEGVIKFTPRAGHIFAGNKLPAAGDPSRGFWRRVLVVEFNKEFKPGKAERFLDEYLIKNELAGICNWALEGAKRLLERGAFTVPFSSQRAKEKWSQESNPVALWLEEETRTCPPEDGTSIGELYDSYKDWCKASGRQPLNREHFARRLAMLGVKSTGRRFTEAGARVNFYPVQLIASRYLRLV